MLYNGQDCLQPRTQGLLSGWREANVGEAEAMGGRVWALTYSDVKMCLPARKQVGKLGGYPSEHRFLLWSIHRFNLVFI